MKFTKTHEKQIREFMEQMDKDGVCSLDQWTSGSGRFTTNRALPPFVQRFENKEYAPTELPKHGTTERQAYYFFANNPRRKACLVLDREALMRFLFDAAHGEEF